MRPRSEGLVVLAAVVYVVITGWAMSSLSYEVWGGFVIAPILTAITVPLLRRTFTGELATLFPIAVGGLMAKFVGAIFRYWVAFDAYGGNADAGRYHEFGRHLAGDIRSGAASLSNIIPSGNSTQFVERFTASMYTIFGSSRLGGFFVYAWLAYLGSVLFVVAGIRAVPGLGRRRYAFLVFFAPSLLFWPSSIGKESLLMLFLGLTTFGGARLLHRRWRGWSVPITAFGVFGAALVRPHFAAIWSAGLVIGLVASVFVRTPAGRRDSRFGAALLVVFAVAVFALAAGSALRFLNPAGEKNGAAPLVDRIDAIFNETERRTDTGGSTFAPVVINGPLDWPGAVARTLTRPLITEVTNFTELLPGLEVFGLMVLAAVGWRRLVNVVVMMRRSPYLWFAVAVLVMFGLAFSTFRNLGLLTRQRSLVVPFIVLLVSVPPWKSTASVRPPLPQSRERSRVTA
ncbi:MAG: hypothetical protein RLZ14_2003 [Actinomycetota bacterium]